jgi:hypothetical protein
VLIAVTLIVTACGGGGGGEGTPNGAAAVLRLYPPISGATLPVGAAGSLDVEVRGGKRPYTITSSDASVQMGLSDDNRLVVLSTNKEGSSEVVVYDSSLPVQQVKIKVDAQTVPVASSVGTSVNLAPNESRQINIRGGVRPYTVSSSNDSVVAATVSGASVTVVGQAKDGTATIKVTDAVGATLDITAVVQVTTLSVTPSTLVGPAASTNSLTIAGGVAPYTVSSNNTAVVSASMSGVSTVSLRLLAKGASTITVTDSSGKSVSVTVTVNSDVLKVSPMNQSVPESTAASVDYLIAGGTTPYAALISAADAASVTSWSITGSKLTVVVPAGPCVAEDKVIPIDIYDATLVKQTVTLTISNSAPAACP